MKKEKLYSEFEELGQRLGVKIIKGKGNFTGGICIVKDETVIVVNKMKPIEHRLKILATSFLEYNLDEKKYFISHLDLDRLNCKLTNLRLIEKCSYKKL